MLSGTGAEEAERAALLAIANPFYIRYWQQGMGAIVGTLPVVEGDRVAQQAPCSVLWVRQHEPPLC
uniref:Uncharacterized protein n=1 Tax=Desertifilum tharense IPPAS B-1220 TaxID=1781255 RepID=A0ACD5GQW8_9CYAN